MPEKCGKAKPKESISTDGMVPRDFLCFPRAIRVFRASNERRRLGDAKEHLVNIWLMDHCIGKVMKDVSSQLFGIVETHKFRGGGHRKDEQLEWQVLRKRKLAQKPV